MKTLMKRRLPGIKRNIMKLIVYPYLFLRAKDKRIFIRPNSSDINVLYHTFIEKEYNIPFVINDPKIIIDGGANIGLTTLLFTSQYPGATIFAIEPESSNFDLLTKNTSQYKKIVPLQYGIWSTDSKLKIENPHKEKWSFVTTEVNDASDYDIAGISIKMLMTKYNIDTIDIFKIDIEGAEKELFSRNEESWITKTKWIIIELHGKECRDVFERAMSKYCFKHVYTNGENIFYKNENL